MSVATLTVNFSKMKIGKIENFDSDQQKPAKISKNWFDSADFKNYGNLKAHFWNFMPSKKQPRSFKVPFYFCLSIICFFT
jgi:hypothetical protein